THDEIGAFQSSKLYYAIKLARAFTLDAGQVGTTNTLAVVASGLLMALFWQQTDLRYNIAFEFLVGNVMLGFSVNW
ncbi:hypothetical protein HK405_013935, partial [Cladochytrium tenue]